MTWAAAVVTAPTPGAPNPDQPQSERRRNKQRPFRCPLDASHTPPTPLQRNDYGRGFRRYYDALMICYRRAANRRPIFSTIREGEPLKHFAILLKLDAHFHVDVNLIAVIARLDPTRFTSFHPRPHVEKSRVFSAVTWSSKTEHFGIRGSSKCLVFEWFFRRSVDHVGSSRAMTERVEALKLKSALTHRPR